MLAAWTVLLAAVGAGGVMAEGSYQKVATRKLMNGDTLEEYKFPNGLQVLLVPRHQAKVLTYQIWFRVGSVNEKLDPKLKKTGLAHLFEHMMFRGSKRYPDGKFDEITSRLGAERQNATTYFYRTNYYESIPSRNLEPLVELEADRMRDLNLTKDLLEKEKGAVVGELRRHLDSPMSIAWDELMRLSWQEAPYRYTVLGTEEEIKGFTLEEAQYFYKTYYAPNNATIIVVGDTTADKLLPILEKHYGDMKAQEVPHVPVPLEPPQTKERRFESTHPQASSETLLVGYRIPGIDSPDAVPLSLLSTHLSKGMEARLRKLLVDTGIAVRASAGTSSQPDLFEFVVALAEGQTAEKALAILDKEVAALQTTALSKASFERALNQELLALYDDIMNNSDLANWLGEFLMLSGNYMRGFEIIEGYKKLTPADLKQVANKYLQKSGRSVVIVRPEKKAAEAKKKGAA
jgi:predicted Zn-dependent peptidase